jgi:hypothetical protein
LLQEANVPALNEKPELDQYFAGGVANQAIEWNLAQHTVVSL